MPYCIVCLDRIEEEEHFSPGCCKNDFHRECYLKWRSIGKSKCVMHKTIYQKIDGELVKVANVKR